MSRLSRVEQTADTAAFPARGFSFPAVAWFVSAVLLATVGAVRAAVDYTREVKPLLAEHCYKCHGASQQKADLRLDTATSAFKGGENGTSIKPGKAADSLLIQVVKGTHDSIARMPYKKPALNDGQIDLLARWIDEGAKAPANETPESARHWSFVPPQRSPLPSASHPIDAFIQQRLARDKIAPAPEADRVTLIRRLSLDLTGLPPAPEEVNAFVADTSPNAYSVLVERLLASAHYGERWGRWWLDAARYADSNGYSIDAPRQIWKYRDWVIASLNADMPFDEFAVEQLAGDLLPGATMAQKVATGFNRNTQINQEGGIDPEQFRIESAMDRVNTYGSVFLGLTVGCAQCHDHKFDPIKQREYYQLFAFFNSTVDDGHGKAAPGGMLVFSNELESAESTAVQLEEARADLERFLDTKGSDVVNWEHSLTPEQRAKLKPNLKSALMVAWKERTLAQKRATYSAFKADDPEFKSRNTKLTALEKDKHKPISTLVMEELDKPRPSTIFIKGDFTRPGDKVEPAFPAVLHPAPEKTSGLRNRLDLARWTVDPANPLTARVIVNRVWQQYFGRGLVETENDFGTQGAAPTHPELLDWLACEFMQPKALPGEEKVKPWSLKHLHRLIVSSATYKQSSRIRPELATLDPINKLLARQSRLRLDAEIVRDAALTSSGLLSQKMGGPPVFPPQPDGVMNLGQSRREWKASTGEDRYRRGVYTHFWRATPHPALAVFDAADGFSACTRRIRSNTPLQALTLLNDQQFFEFAEALAGRVLKANVKDETARLQYAFQLCVARKPLPAEQQRLEQLLQMQGAAGTDAGQREAWKTVARVLLNLDETITRE